LVNREDVNKNPGVYKREYLIRLTLQIGSFPVKMVKDGNPSRVFMEKR